MFVIPRYLSIFESTKQTCFSTLSIYMARQQRNEKVVYRALFLSRVIIAAGIRWVVTNSGEKTSPSSDQIENINTKDTSKYYIDETVILQ